MRYSAPLTTFFEEDTMKKTPRKLTLSKETLRTLQIRNRDADFGGTTPLDPDTSCRDSCYLQSCGGGCTISTGLKG
jgi:hypothetical protein